MSTNVNFYIVAGVQLQGTGYQLYEVTENDPHIDVFFDDETKDRPVVGQTVVDFHRHSDSEITEIVYPDPAVVAERLTAIGIVTHANEVKVFACALWR